MIAYWIVPKRLPATSKLSVSPVPWRVPAAEKLLEGSALDDNACRAAAAALLDAAEPLRDNGYKVTLARELVRRALRSLVS